MSTRWQVNFINNMNFDFITTGSQGGYRRKGVTEVTISKFFESGDNIGYVKLDTFKSMLSKREQSPAFVEQYQKLFNCSNEEHDLLGRVVVKIHKTNLQNYIHLNFTRGRMKSEATIYLFDNIEKFINDYANKLIKVNFTWNELVEFCESH